MSNLIDLTGQVFGRLKVIKKAESNNRGETMWLCQCSCKDKKQICVRSKSLRNGDTKSCGCLRTEVTQLRSKVYNDYEIQDCYVIMYTQKGEIFLVDLEDFWKVKKYCWRKETTGYFVSQIENKNVLLHRIIMDCVDSNIDIDHIGGEKTKYDNRKSNLRLASTIENCMNRQLSTKNKTGVTGVCWDECRQKYMAYINYNKKRINLGRYDCLEDATRVRKEAEKLYYKEWSYDDSQKLYLTQI